MDILGAFDNHNYNNITDHTRKPSIVKGLARKYAGLSEISSEELEKSINEKKKNNLTNAQLKYLEFIYYHTLLPENTYEADISRFSDCIGKTLLDALLFIRYQLAQKYKPTHYIHIKMLKIDMKKIYFKIPELYKSVHTKKHLPELFWECNKRFGLHSVLVNMVLGRYLDQFEVMLDKHSSLGNKRISFVRYNKHIIIFLPHYSSINTVQVLCKEFFEKAGIEINMIVSKRTDDTTGIYFEKARFVYSKHKKVFFQPKVEYLNIYYINIRKISKKYENKEYTKEEFIEKLYVYIEEWLANYTVYCTRYTFDRLQSMLLKVANKYNVKEEEMQDVLNLFVLCRKAGEIGNREIKSKHLEDETRKMNHHIKIYNNRYNN